LDLGLVIATLIYVVVGGVIGVRLLRLYRRTRGFPELALGLGECLLAAAVPPLFAVVQVVPSESVVRAAIFAGHLAYTAGCAVMILFPWRVFRPGDGWARALAVLLVAALAGAGLLGMARAFLPADLAALRDPQTPAFVLMEWISVLGFLWT